jgi:acyl-CoA-binding protein
MSDLEQRFEAAAGTARQLASKPDNETMLLLYSLYKQAAGGDVSGKRPGILDPVGRAKYDAWAKLKGTNRETAMQRYVDLVDELKGSSGSGGFGD